MDKTHPLRNATLSIELEARLRNAALYLSRTRMSATTTQTASPDARLFPDSQRLAVERPQPVRWMRNCSVRRGTANRARSRNAIRLSTERNFLGPFLDPLFLRRELNTGATRRFESRAMTQAPLENRSIQLQTHLHNLASRFALRAKMFHRGTTMHDGRHLPHTAHGPFVDPRMSRFRLHCAAMLTQNIRSTGGCAYRHPPSVRGKLRNGNFGSLSGCTASCPGLFGRFRCEARKEIGAQLGRLGNVGFQNAGPPIRRDRVALPPLPNFGRAATVEIRRHGLA